MSWFASMRSLACLRPHLVQSAQLARSDCGGGLDKSRASMARGGGGFVVVDQTLARCLVASIAIAPAGASGSSLNEFNAKTASRHSRTLANTQ